MVGDRLVGCQPEDAPNPDIISYSLAAVELDLPHNVSTNFMLSAGVG